MGIEPVTYVLQRRCPTHWAITAHTRFVVELTI